MIKLVSSSSKIIRLKNFNVLPRIHIQYFSTENNQDVPSAIEDEYANVDKAFMKNDEKLIYLGPQSFTIRALMGVSTVNLLVILKFHYFFR